MTLAYPVRGVLGPAAGAGTPWRHGPVGRPWWPRVGSRRSARCGVCPAMVWPMIFVSGAASPVTVAGRGGPLCHVGMQVMSPTHVTAGASAA